MNFFLGILDAVKRKQAELKDRKEFVDMVEQKAKPLRRKAYMEQMLREVVQEGIAKAKADAEARKPKVKKTEEDFGIPKLEDPFKYLNGPKEVESKVNKTKLKGKKK